MKKCSWWKGHCLHPIEGTERKKEVSKKKRHCDLQDKYIYERFMGKCIDIIVNAKCCWCDHTEDVERIDFDTIRAINYPDYKDKK